MIQALWTDTDTLAAIRAAADRGEEPHASNVAKIVADASKLWTGGRAEGRYITTEVDKQKRAHVKGHPDQYRFLKEGASDAYAMALASHLAQHPVSRSAFRDAARRRLDQIQRCYGFHGQAGRLDNSGSNQCVLDLALSLPTWISTAQLVESDLSEWLDSSQSLTRVLWASAQRRNNWGANGSCAAWAAGRHMKDAVIMDDALTMQLARIDTFWEGDSKCAIYGIQPHGGIPDELRRGSSGCEADHIHADDGSLAYQCMHVEALVKMAEMMWRAGGSRLYEAGDGAIGRAIEFVLDNPIKSWPWPSRFGNALVAASDYYGLGVDPALFISGDRGGRDFPYYHMTSAPVDLPAEPGPLTAKVTIEVPGVGTFSGELGKVEA